jgi:hypothetical protein
MRPNDENSPIDQALIDRVVDGGLTPEELRAAVSRLELVSEGWKRCAVAFIEAQVLGESFRALGQAQNDESASQILPIDRAEAARRTRLEWLRRAAASVIVAASFAIGWIAHGTRPDTPAHESVVQDLGTIPPQPAIKLADSSRVSPPYDAPSDDRRFRPGDRDQEVPEAPGQAIKAVARIRFGPENSRAEVPVLAGPGVTQEWLARQPPPIPEHGRVALERQGYQVEQQRRFFTTILDDGRRVAVPVDHVQIQYTGNEPL